MTKKVSRKSKWTYSIDKVILLDGHRVDIKVRSLHGLVLQVGQLIVDELLEQKEQQLVVIAAIGQVLGEVLLHRLGDAVLLCVNERLDGHTNGHVHVVLVDVLAQVHARMSLRYANDRLDVTHGDRYATGHHGLATQIGVHARDLVLVHVVEARVHLLLAVHNVLLEQVLRDDLHAECVRNAHYLCRLGRVHHVAGLDLIRRMVANVRLGDESS
jgi:hypothetical protein